MSSFQFPLAAPRFPAARLLRGQAHARTLAIGAVLLAMMVVSGWVWQLASPLGFNDDAAQTLSTASQWQRGEGLTTNVLYYDSQLQQQAPALQTVWPPAMAVLTAVISDLTGLAPSRALVALLLAAHLLTAAGIGWAAAKTWSGGASVKTQRWWIGSASSLVWLLIAPALLGVLRGLSEPLYGAFVTFTLLALLLAVPPDETPVWQRPAGWRWLWLLLASAAVTAAVLTRYQAIALIGPLAISCTMVGAPGTRATQRIRLGVAAISAPVIALAAMFWRNWSLTGTLTGGASVTSGQSLSEMAARMSWLPSVWQPVVMWGLLGSMLLSGLVALVLWARGFNTCRSAPARLGRRARTAAVFCLSAYAVNLALLITLGLMSTVYVIELRYLTVNLLLMVLPATIGLRQITVVWTNNRASRAPVSALVPAGMVGLAMLLQILAFKQVIEDRLANTPPAKISQIMSTPLIEDEESAEKISLLSWLAAQPSPPRLLSANAQSLALVLRAHQVPVAAILGVPVPVFSDKSWHEEPIRELATRHSVDFVMGFRQVPTWVFPDPLDTWLNKTNGDLAWLKPISATPALFLGRIHKPVNSSLCGPSESDKLVTTVAHHCD